MHRSQIKLFVAQQQIQHSIATEPQFQIGMGFTLMADMQVVEPAAQITERETPVLVGEDTLLPFLQEYFGSFQRVEGRIEHPAAQLPAAKAVTFL